jgi:hypothetical protein
VPPRPVLVPVSRLGRWFENFAGRHGEFDLAVVRGRLVVQAPDGTLAEAALPFALEYAGPANVARFVADASAAARQFSWGVLLVRKGGFAVASVQGEALVASKVGQRHVQGRTKAGGQSQQRFARRRDNQARMAYEAAAEHAHRILVLESARLHALVCGGDHRAVDLVLDDPRLAHLAALRTDPWLPVPDPRRAVLEQAVRDGRSVTVRVLEPEAK